MASSFEELIAEVEAVPIEERLRTIFFDIGTVVYFLRLVIWIVPGFTVDGHADRLRALHEQIQRDGSLVAHASRFPIEARKPG